MIHPTPEQIRKARDILGEPTRMLAADFVARSAGIDPLDSYEDGARPSHVLVFAYGYWLADFGEGHEGGRYRLELERSDWSSDEIDPLRCYLAAWHSAELGEGPDPLLADFDADII